VDITLDPAAVTASPGTPAVGLGLAPSGSTLTAAPGVLAVSVGAGVVTPTTAVIAITAGTMAVFLDAEGVVSHLPVTARFTSTSLVAAATTSSATVMEV
jgi:hypothetical protein